MATIEEITTKINSLATKFYVFYQLNNNNAQVKSILTDIKDLITDLIDNNNSGGESSGLIGEIPNLPTNQDVNDYMFANQGKYFIYYQDGALKLASTEIGSGYQFYGLP